MTSCVPFSVTVKLASLSDVSSQSSKVASRDAKRYAPEAGVTATVGAVASRLYVATAALQLPATSQISAINVFGPGTSVIRASDCMSTSPSPKSYVNALVTVSPFSRITRLASFNARSSSHVIRTERLLAPVVCEPGVMSIAGATPSYV